MAVMIARNISKRYIEGRATATVLKGVSLTIAEGEIVALEGPSGSGKTTLLSVVGCILTPSGGSLEIAGKAVDFSDPASLPRIRREKLGFVFQQFNLFPALTALENVAYALELRGAKEAAALATAQRTLEDVGLAHRLHYLPRDLSGGQKQRVAIARALAGRAPLLLADEPTANLDAVVGAEVLEMFRALAKREHRSVLIVTHDPKVRAIADTVVRIEDGSIVS